jgi:hypothetical protein
MQYLSAASSSERQAPATDHDVTTNQLSLLSQLAVYFSKESFTNKSINNKGPDVAPSPF